MYPVHRSSVQSILVHRIALKSDRAAPPELDELLELEARELELELEARELELEARELEDELDEREDEVELEAREELLEVDEAAVVPQVRGLGPGIV
ncbi:hypothetical protein FRC20_011842 [Serendipita sp. 405]|nr:hypothetical protein FRC20_011842 [Serendipita sp. 405]